MTRQPSSSSPTDTDGNGGVSRLFAPDMPVASRASGFAVVKRPGQHRGYRDPARVAKHSKAGIQDLWPHPIYQGLTLGSMPLAAGAASDQILAPAWPAPERGSNRMTRRSGDHVYSLFTRISTCRRHGVGSGPADVARTRTDTGAERGPFGAPRLHSTRRTRGQGPRGGRTLWARACTRKRICQPGWPPRVIARTLVSSLRGLHDGKALRATKGKGHGQRSRPGMMPGTAKDDCGCRWARLSSTVPARGAAPSISTNTRPEDQPATREGQVDRAVG